MFAQDQNPQLGAAEEEKSDAVEDGKRNPEANGGREKFFSLFSAVTH